MLPPCTPIQAFLCRWISCGNALPVEIPKASLLKHGIDSEDQLTTPIVHSLARCLVVFLLAAEYEQLEPGQYNCGAKRFR